jgi:two-component system cell cycle sensor histidine kinase/response regulator CckA
VYSFRYCNTHPNFTSALRVPSGRGFLRVFESASREKLGFASCFVHCISDMGDADLQAWEAFFTASSDPCFLIRAQSDGQFLLSRVNDAWECATGIPRTTVLGSRVDAHLPLELAELMVARMTESVMVQAPSEFEEELEFPTGKRVWRTRLVPWQVRGEQYLAGFARDVTERVAAERHRGRLESKLLDAQKLESLGILAGGIAHDFNNLLTGILGNVSLMRLELPAASALVEHVDQIEAVTIRAADLCRQLLAYSGKGRFVVRPLDVSELTRQTAPLLQLSIGKAATLRLDLAEELPAVDADATQMRQVLMNLVVNAAEALGERPGVISVTSGTLYAEGAYLRNTFLAPELADGKYVFLEVSDNGCGMGPGTQAKIFDPFFSTKFIGRGLGLSAVLGIVRGHKGAIKVYSELGRGTTIKLLFPAIEGHAARALATAPAQPALQRRGTVLVVDDEEVVRGVAARILGSCGFDVVLANDGHEGVTRFKERSPEIVAVLMDLTMPQMDGVDAFREIRGVDENVPVLLMSGYNEQDAVMRFAGKGLAGFVQKPFTVEILRERLLSVLR